MLLFQPLLPPKPSASAATAAATTSLGSPGSKHRSNGGSLAGGAPNPADEVEAEKPIRPSSRSPRSVYLIPVVTFLCFLILYLISYEPSPLERAKELAKSVGGQALRLAELENFDQGMADVIMPLAGSSGVSWTTNCSLKPVVSPPVNEAIAPRKENELPNNNNFRVPDRGLVSQVSQIPLTNDLQSLTPGVHQGDRAGRKAGEPDRDSKKDA